LIKRFADPEFDIDVVRSHETLRNRTAYQLFLILKMEGVDKKPSSEGGSFDDNLTRLEKRQFAIDWANLTRPQKEEWCLREAEDRERYIRE